MKISEPPQKQNKPANPLSIVLNRVILFSAGIGLLAWGFAMAAPRFTGIATARALVNGKIITINSPIRGEVKAKTQLNSGVLVQAKQPILTVLDNLSNAQRSPGLEFDLATERAKLESIDIKIQQLEQGIKHKQIQKQSNPQLAEAEHNTLKEQLALVKLDIESKNTGVDAAIEELKQTIDSLKLELKNAELETEVAKSKYDKFSDFENKGTVSDAAVEDAYKTWKTNSNIVTVLDTKLKSAEIKLVQQQRLKAQLPQQQKLQLNLATRQAQQLAKQKQQDLLTMEINNYRAKLNDFKQEKIEIEKRIEAKTKSLAESTKYGLIEKSYQAIAHTEAILWESLVQNGDQVSEGQALVKTLNCQKIWVDAFVNINDLKRFEVGSSAEVEVFSNEMKLKGTVKTIRSPLSGMERLGLETAVNPINIETKQLAQVKIELDNPQKLLQDKSRDNQFCYVGQPVRVTISSNQ